MIDFSRSSRFLATPLSELTLTELEVGGIATTASAHSAILASPDFQAGEHSTKWVEETLDLSDVSGSPKDATEVVDEEPLTRKDVVLEVNGKRFEVAAWVPETAGAVATPKSNKPRRSASNAGSSAGSGQVAVPMQGTIVKVLVEVGQEVAEGEAVVVLEAMKMENELRAPRSGVVQAVHVDAGDAVEAGALLVSIEEAQ